MSELRASIGDAASYPTVIEGGDSSDVATTVRRPFGSPSVRGRDRIHGQMRRRDRRCR